MRVLIVDDSVVFRSQIKAALAGIPGVEVIGVAANGKIALQKLTQVSADLVALDLDMPEMSGLETVKEIRKAGFPVRIVMFSAPGEKESDRAYAALAAGAEIVISKPDSEEPGNEKVADHLRQELESKVFQFSRKTTQVNKEKTSFVAEVRTIPRSYQKRDLETFHPAVLVIGSSTGGPPALEQLLKSLSLPLRIPVVIVQHMPPKFTESLAQRLQVVTGIQCVEAKHGEVLKANRVFVAPGDFHLTLGKQNSEVVLKLDQTPARNSVRPSVDVLFESAAEAFGSKVCGIILTGMGEDGLVGCERIKEKGGAVLIQDQQSSVVFGMPGAVYQQGCYDYIGNLQSLNSHVKRLTT